MKKTFPEYARKTEDDIKKFWNSATIVFDTNVLLDLYEYQETTINEILNAIKNFKSRTWLPHHVGKEFHSGRVSTIKKVNNKFYDVKEALEKTKNDLNNNHVLKQIIQKDIDEMCEKFGKAWEERNDFLKNDFVLDALEEIYDGRIGKEPDQTSYDNLMKKGKERYDNKIPPGYKDKPEEHPDNMYGDFIIWSQIMDYSKEKDKNIIFISNEKKEDWVSKHGGIRKDLLKEFIDKTKKMLYMYDIDGFIKYAKEYGKAEISEDTAKEVKTITSMKILKDDDDDKSKRYFIVGNNIPLDSWKREDYINVNEDIAEIPTLAWKKIRKEYIDDLSNEEQENFWHTFIHDNFKDSYIKRPRVISNAMRYDILKNRLSLKKDKSEEKDNKVEDDKKDDKDKK